MLTSAVPFCGDMDLSFNFNAGCSAFDISHGVRFLCENERNYSNQLVVPRIISIPGVR